MESANAVYQDSPKKIRYTNVIVKTKPGKACKIACFILRVILFMKKKSKKAS